MYFFDALAIGLAFFAISFILGPSMGYAGPISFNSASWLNTAVTVVQLRYKIHESAKIIPLKECKLNTIDIL